MEEYLSDIDEQLLNRLDSCAVILGASRTQIIERALKSYLDQIEALELHGSRTVKGSVSSVDWGLAKETLVASRCPYPKCPHNGSCPIEICPL